MLSFEKDQKYTCVYIHNRIWEIEKRRMGIRNTKRVLRATFSPFFLTIVSNSIIHVFLGAIGIQALLHFPSRDMRLELVLGAIKY